MAKAFKQSETVVIKRSQINFAPYNPRKESKKVVEQISKNFKNVGYLGGIVWNETTSNLVGGHKRIEAMDLHYKYDNTPNTDYDVKVEKVLFDLKTEREQNIFLNNPRVQGETDYLKLSTFINEIDIQNTGLNEYDLNIIQSVSPDFNFGEINNFQNEMIGQKNDVPKEKDNLINAQSQTPEEKKQAIKDLKSNIKEDYRNENKPTYFTVTFDTYESKAEFLESLGLNADETFINGVNFSKLVFE